MAKLTQAFEAIALKLQEQAAAELGHNDLQKWLSDACSELAKGAGGGYSYCYLVDFFGDDKSGDVIVCCNSDLKRAPYEIRQVDGKFTATIDMEDCEDVLPRTIYEPEADEADHVASMEAKRDRLYLDDIIPFYERFISKAERDAADPGSFAGKGTSFPILKPGDIMPAVRSLGRAGSGNHPIATLKAHIIKIAKKKGWQKYLPKAWRDGDGGAEDTTDDKESAPVELTGDVIPLKEGAVGQDGSAYLKLIAPGRGSSGFYPAEVLERDGPRVFPAGTKNFWDHQTDAEEAARPEGSLRNLASVLTEDAHYEAAGPAGPGLYARAKVFEEFRQPVDDLAKHIGMSIRAAGRAKEGVAPDGKRGPIIEELSRGISVDYVTTPGAGGQVLQLFEAARGAAHPPTQESENMTDEERRLLKETQAELKKLRERAALQDAHVPIAEYFSGVRIPRAIEQRVTRTLMERWIETGVPVKDNKLDVEAVKKAVEAETREVCALVESVAPTGRPFGLGAPGETEEQRKQREKALAESDKDTMKQLAELFMGSGKDNKARRKAFREGRAA